MASVTESDMDQAISSTRENLGYKELRPQQILAVRHFLRWNDVFVSFPTSSGKCLCYCLLPLVFDLLRQTSQSQSSIVLVASPLIALMQDQVRAMNELNCEDSLNRFLRSEAFSNVAQHDSKKTDTITSAATKRSNFRSCSNAYVRT